jgi:hypothetical protein
MPHVSISSASLSSISASSPPTDAELSFPAGASTYSSNSPALQKHVSVILNTAIFFSCSVCMHQSSNSIRRNSALIRNLQGIASAVTILIEVTLRLHAVVMLSTGCIGLSVHFGQHMQFKKNHFCHAQVFLTSNTQSHCRRCSVNSNVRLTYMCTYLLAVVALLTAMYA